MSRENKAPTTEQSAEKIQFKASQNTRASNFIIEGIGNLAAKAANCCKPIPGDNIIGYVHAFDMFKKPKSLHAIIKAVEWIPETMRIQDVFNQLVKKRKSIAVVLDMTVDEGC